MTDEELHNVFVDAYELQDRSRGKYSCTTIDRVSSPKQFEPRRIYTRIMSPEGQPMGAWATRLTDQTAEGNWWPDDILDRQGCDGNWPTQADYDFLQECRLTALAFMIAMSEHGDLHVV